MAAACLAVAATPGRAGSTASGAKVFGAAQRLLPGTVADGHIFGSSVSRSGDWLAASAPGAGGNRSGEVYLFARDPSGGWKEDRVIAAPNPGRDRFFGMTVLMRGDWMFISEGTERGSKVWAYELARGAWERSRSPFSRNSARNFGIALCQAGQHLMIAADDVVAIYARTNSKWRLERTLGRELDLPNTTFDVRSLACTPDRLAVGVPRAQGFALVFLRNGKQWRLEQKLVPSGREGFIGFGSSLSLDEERLVVGGAGFNDPGEGKVFTYVLQAGVWEEESVLRAKDKRRGNDFGAGVTLADDLIVAVDPDATAKPNLEAAGAAYVFQRVGQRWRKRQRITVRDAEPLAAFGGFGRSAIDLQDGVLVIGANFAGGVNTTGNPRFRGAVYVFDR